MAKRTEVRPTHKATAVTAFGITARSGMPRSRRGPGGLIAKASSGGRSLGDAFDELRDANLRDHRLAGNRALAQQDLRGGALRQIDVDAAAEADQPDALAGDDPVAFADPGNDAPRDEAGNLGEGDLL